MLAIDSLRTSVNIKFLENGHKMSTISCNDDSHCLPSTSSRLYRARGNKSYLTSLDDIEDSTSADFDQNEKRDIEAHISSSRFQSRMEEVSSLSAFTYRPGLDNLNDLEDIKVDTVFMYSLPRHSLSQDDCLNSASHPMLFTSRFLQQAWYIRAYKFQLGLINSREVMEPISHSQVPATD
jgi:hypothetical protein